MSVSRFASRTAARKAESVCCALFMAAVQACLFTGICGLVTSYAQRPFHTLFTGTTIMPSSSHSAAHSKSPSSSSASGSDEERLTVAALRKCKRGSGKKGHSRRKK